MTEIQVDAWVPEIPRAVPLGGARLTALLDEWAMLPEPIEALQLAMDSAASDAYGAESKERPATVSGVALTQLRKAWKDDTFRQAFIAWRGDPGLRNRDYKLLIGLAITGTIITAATRHASSVRDELIEVARRRREAELRRQAPPEPLAEGPPALEVIDDLVDWTKPPASVPDVPL